MPKRTKKVKARGINRVNYGLLGSPTIPIWELPATTEAYDAMCSQIGNAIKGSEVAIQSGFWNQAGANALRSLGITRPKKSKS